MKAQSKDRIRHPLLLWIGRYLSDWLDRAKMREHLFVIIVAIFIGILCGFGAVGFRHLIDFFHHLFWNAHDLTLEHLAGVGPWRMVLIPTLGGLLVGPLVYFFAREAKGHGVPEVMVAVSKNGIIRPRVAIAKALASAITIASGGSAGREGPIIQIGSALGSSMGQLLQVSRRRMRTFVGCGAAAGIAATFDAPIAGALFSVEVILAEFGVAQFSPIVISSVLATVIARHYFDHGSVIEAPSEYNLVSILELGPYVVLGILCGVVSVVFVKVLYFFEDGFDRIKPIPGYLKPMIGGFLLGLIGLALPHVYGDGYASVNLALINELPVKLVALLLIAKIVATSFTLGSGGSGGVFAPSLFIGAMSGSLLGKGVSALFGSAAGAAGGYALVGMGGVVAGTTHAPITAILIIFELTHNYNIILPLMTVSIISILISMRFNKESIYTMKLVRRGIDLFKGRSLDLLKSIPVRTCVSGDLQEVSPDDSAIKLMELMRNTEKAQFYVVGEKRRLIGCVLLGDLGRMLTHRHGLEHVMLADDLTNEDVPCCTPAENLSQAMHKFERSGLSELPVVDNEKDRTMIGVLRYTDVVGIYNNEVIKLDTADELASRVSSSGSTGRVKIVDGFSLTEWDPPQSITGKTLQQAQLPTRYNVHVILVKREDSQPIIPDRDYLISEHDTLVIYGPDEALEKIRHF